METLPYRSIRRFLAIAAEHLADVSTGPGSTVLYILEADRLYRAYRNLVVRCGPGNGQDAGLTFLDVEATFDRFEELEANSDPRGAIETDLGPVAVPNRWTLAREAALELYRAHAANQHARR